MWVAEDIRMTLYHLDLGKKSRGRARGQKYLKFQTCARRLKICMRAAEDIRMTVCYLDLGKTGKGAGSGQGPDLAPQSHYHLHHVF